MKTTTKQSKYVRTIQDFQDFLFCFFCLLSTSVHFEFVMPTPAVLHDCVTPPMLARITGFLLREDGFSSEIEAQGISVSILGTGSSLLSHRERTHREKGQFLPKLHGGRIIPAALICSRLVFIQFHIVKLAPSVETDTDLLLHFWQFLC